MPRQKRGVVLSYTGGRYVLVSTPEQAERGEGKLLTLTGADRLVIERFMERAYEPPPRIEELPKR